MRKTGPVIIFIAAVTLGAAQPPDGAAPARMEIVSQSDTISVKADGRYTIEWDSERRLLDASGRDDVAQKTFTFDAPVSTLDVLEAETIKADGKHIKVKPDQIRLQEDPATAGAPTFSTSKQKTIVFPNVEVGDSVHFRVRQTVNEPDFAGHFTHADHFGPDQRVLAYKLILTAPQSLKLRSETVGLKEQMTEAGGNRIWNWSFSQPNARAIDSDKANIFVDSPHLVVTTFPDWETIAKAYQSRASDKVKITPEIQRLADGITEGVTDRREQAEKIYDWVRGNIRYVAIYLAHGGYVPHSAIDILHNKYGDCKDHVVLLEALLRAKGIESHGVLIASGQVFKLTFEANPYAFDHIVTYVPELDVYLDATAQYLPFGNRVDWLSGKRVLHVGGSPGLETTPSMLAADNKASISTSVVLERNGSITGKLKEISTGTLAVQRRADIAGVDPLQNANIVQKLLAQQGLQGKGGFTADDPAKGSASYAVDITFSADHTGLDLTGPEAVSSETPLQLGYSISSMTAFANSRPEPHYSTACTAHDLTEHYEIALPDGITIPAMPKDVTINEGPINYRSTYLQKGQNIEIIRHYTMSIDRGYCTPDEIAAMTKTLAAAQQDLKRRIILIPAQQ